jgi:hypothetical protein
VRRIGEAVVWKGDVVTAPTGRIPLPFHAERNLDTDPGRVRKDSGHVEVVTPQESLKRTIARERANPAEHVTGVELLHHARSDALPAEIG